MFSQQATLLVQVFKDREQTFEGRKSPFTPYFSCTRVAKWRSSDTRKDQWENIDRSDRGGDRGEDRYEGNFRPHLEKELWKQECQHPGIFHKFFTTVSRVKEP